MSDQLPALADEPQSMLSVISQAARDPAVDVVKLQALLQMQRDVDADQARIEFTRALHLAQGEIPPVEKTGVIKLVRDGVDKGKLPFATFEEMSRVLKPIMDKHGFTISFDMAERAGGGAIITGTLTHSAGHSKAATIPLPIDTGPGRNNLQAMGSTLSYGKRYLCEMFFNIVRKGVDDDGQQGGGSFITDQQIDQIDKLLVETGSDRGKFLLTMGAPSVDRIKRDAFVVAMNLLAMKARK